MYTRQGSYPSCFPLLLKSETLSEVLILQEKYCKPCGKWIELSAEYWSRNAARRDGFDSQCKECRKKYHSEYHQKNKDKINERSKEYRKTNASKDYHKNYREKNKEHLKMKAKEWQENNKEKCLEKYRRYRERNHEKLAKLRREKEATPEHKERVRKYYEANKEKSFNRVRKRRTLKKSTVALLTTEQWRQAKEHFNNQCAYCGSEGNLSQDHIIPISLGGYHVRTNVAPACLSCNLSKSNKEMIAWYCGQDFFDGKRLKRLEKWAGIDRKTNTQQLSIL